MTPRLGAADTVSLQPGKVRPEARERSGERHVEVRYRVAADPLHGVGEQLADLGIVVGRNGGHTGDVDTPLDLLGLLGQRGDSGVYRQLDTATMSRWVVSVMARSNAGTTSF